jgi:Protein of unknown function (DUF2034)
LNSSIHWSLLLKLAILIVVDGADSDRITYSMQSLLSSAVHRGCAFEQRALDLLHHNLSMSLSRVGGRSDGGIDLLGWWWLPPGIKSGSASTSESQSDRNRVRVLGQCKAEKKKIGPKYIREMEGVLHRFITRDQEDHNPSVALFISESPFSKETLLRAHSSSIPFFLLHLPPRDSPDNEADPESQPPDIGSIIWNPALAGTSGILGGQVEARWERSVTGARSGRPGLWFQGHRVPSWMPIQVLK